MTAAPARRCVRVWRAWVLLVGALGLNCRDASGPGFGAGHLAFAPAFQSGAAGIVEFDHIRITLVRPGAGPVLDTVITIPATADSVDLSLTVSLVASREDLLLYLRLVTVAGDTVFRNTPYPQLLTVTAGSTGTPVQSPLEYTGVGSDAVAVVIGTPDTALFFGEMLQLSATAWGRVEQAIPGTPIAWRSLDSLRVRVPNRAVGQVVGGTQRGTARIVAELLTGPADTVLVTVQPVPSQIQIAGGAGQEGPPGGVLGLPLRVRVTAADGLGVRVPARFHALTSGALVGDTLVTTDSAGFAQTVATLGFTTGTQSFQAVVGGLQPLVITANAVIPVASVTVTPASTATDAVGDTIPFSAVARDGSGTPLSVIFAWTSSDAGVVLVNPATGLAVVTGNGTATVIGTAAGVSDSATVVVAQRAVQLAFTGQPSDVRAGDVIAPPVQVSALDRRGHVAANFGDSVSVFRGDVVDCFGTLLGTARVAAVGGVATYADLTFHQACGAGVRLGAFSDSLSALQSDPFTVSPGPAAVIALFSGTDLSDTVAATLLSPLVVRVTDQFANGVSGYDVSWVVTAGGGSFPLTASSTDGSGLATNTWTLGTLAGVQYAEARAPTLSGSPIAFSATAGPGGASQLAFVTQPAGGLAGVVLLPVVVAVQDRFGNRVPTWTDQVVLALGPNNPLGAKLFGTASLDPVDGLASFSDLSVDLPGLAYTLVASSGVLPSKESAPFDAGLVPGVVFAGDSSGGLSSGVFGVNPDGSGRRQLNARGKSGDVHPRLSPDRERVAFTFDEQGGGRNALFVVARLGDTLATLVADTSARRPRWSPDGKNLAFECGDGFSVQQDVCVIPNVTGPITGLDGRGEGTGKLFVTHFDPAKLDGPAAFSWNPLDPSTLVVVRDSSTDKAEPMSRLYLVTFLGQLVQPLSDWLVDPQSARPLQIVGTLDWSADGATIVFAAQDPLVLDVGTPTGQRLYAIGRDGSGLRQLTAGPAFDYQPTFSPDGRQVLFLRDSGCSLDYWRVDVADRVETQVSAEDWCDFSPEPLGYDWSPDGKDIVLVGGEPPGGFGDFAIYTVPAGTTKDTYLSARRLIGRVGQVSGLVSDIQPSWRP